MTGTDTISTEIWQIEIPSDWTEKEHAESSAIYFESPDGTKGVYVSSWQFADDARTVEQIAASFQAVERSRFAEMHEDTWVITETNATEAGIYVSTLDY